jgi:hypothetical protein
MRGKCLLVTLNNGVEMAALGLGVFQTPPDVTTAAVAEPFASATAMSIRPPTPTSARLAMACELTGEDLTEIERAAAAIQVEGERYPPQLLATTGR